MSHVFVNDLRTLVEFAETHGGTDVARVADEMRKTIDVMEEKHVSAIDHRDLWEYGTENVHPARARMTVAAREYKQAEQELFAAQREAEESHSRPVGKYTLKAYGSPDDPWSARTVPENERKSMVRIVETLTNRKELDEALEYWGSGQGYDNQHNSVMYYLHRIQYTDIFMVMHDGGGYLLLKDEIVMNDTTPWYKMIETGIVPQEWLRR